MTHAPCRWSLSTHAPSDAIIVPDAQLLFNGDFKRSGVDLVLSKDDHELVLHDYFKGEKRAALASPDGAHLTGDIVNALTGHVEYAQADGSAAARLQVVGHVTKLTGTATAIRNGVSIILNQGDNVEKGDVRPVRLRFDARHHLHRRHRVRPVVECADGAQRDGLRPQRVEQFLADQPGGGHHLLCRRRDRKARRHEGRHAGRDHGHPRHRGAGRDRLQRSRPGRRARCQIPGSGRAGRHHRLLHPVRQDHAGADRDGQYRPDS